MGKQITAKTLRQALEWIHTQPHSEVKLLLDYGRDRIVEKGIVYANYHEKMKVMAKTGFYHEFRKSIHPNPRPFDTRMFALNARGRRHLRELES